MLRSILSRHPDNHATLAMIMRAVSALAAALLGAVAKAAGSAGVNLGEIIFFRSAGALPVVLVWLAAGPGLTSIRMIQPKAHFARAAIGISSMSVMFYALSLLPLAEAVAVFFIAPLVATCLSALFLRDDVGVHRWAAIGAGFIGVLIVMQPGSSNTDVSLLGIAAGVSAAVLMACVTVTLRKIGSTESEAATVFWFTLIGTVATGCVYPFFYQPHDFVTWMLIMAIGVCGAAIQISATISLRLAPISLTAPLDYTQLFWAALLGWLLWSDLPALSTIIGGLIIAGAGLYTFHRERVRRRLPGELMPAN